MDPQGSSSCLHSAHSAIRSPLAMLCRTCGNVLFTCAHESSTCLAHSTHVFTVAKHGDVTEDAACICPLGACSGSGLFYAATRIRVRYLWGMLALGRGTVVANGSPNFKRPCCILSSTAFGGPGLVARHFGEPDVARNPSSTFPSLAIECFLLLLCHSVSLDTPCQARTWSHVLATRLHMFIECPFMPITCLPPTPTVMRYVLAGVPPFHDTLRSQATRMARRACPLPPHTRHSPAPWPTSPAWRRLEHGGSVPKFSTPSHSSWSLRWACASLPPTCPALPRPTFSATLWPARPHPAPPYPTLPHPTLRCCPLQPSPPRPTRVALSRCPHRNAVPHHVPRSIHPRSLLAAGMLAAMMCRPTSASIGANGPSRGTTPSLGARATRVGWQKGMR